MLVMYPVLLTPGSLRARNRAQRQEFASSQQSGDPPAGCELAKSNHDKEEDKGEGGRRMEGNEEGGKEGGRR